MTRTPRAWIGRAIAEIEKPSMLQADAERLLMAANYGGVVALREEFDRAPSAQLAEALS